jgi:hypothetical protein
MFRLLLAARGRARAGVVAGGVAGVVWFRGCLASAARRACAA